jgi:uncharacterized membrane protein YphA (DoxX/SURF4 family)
MSGSPAYAALQRFLFAPVNPRPLVVLRCLLPVLVVLVFQPMGRFSANPFVESLFAAQPWLGQFLDAPAWYPAVITCSVMLALGLAPRLACAMLVVLLLPALAKLGRYPGRILLWNAILCFGFLRSDAAWSVRQLLVRRPTPSSPRWPLRLIQLSVSLLYAVNVLAKLRGPYLSGQVLSLMSIEMGNFLVQITDNVPLRWGLALPTWLAATGTVLVEAVLAVGVWSQKRKWLVAALGCAFHLALKLVISIGWLDWVAMALYLSFLLPLDGPRNAGPVPDGS